MRTFFPSGLAVAAAMAGLFAGMLAPVVGTSPAAAQFVCDSTTPGGADGATATGFNSVACGTNATAMGVGSTAIGADAGVGADPGNAANTAVGIGAGQNVTGAFNSAFGSSAGRAVTGSQNSAFGDIAGLGVMGDRNSAFGSAAGRSVIGDQNSAFGHNAGLVVTGNSNSAFGDNAGQFVQGSGNVAIGLGAGSGVDFANPLVASNTVAIGTNAVARADGAVAIGNGAEATRSNQVVLGTTDHTYSTPGITSAASKAAQSAPTHIVTSNAGGDLAAYTPGELGLASTHDLAALNNRIRQNTEGVALAMAMAGSPTLLPMENIAVTANWGSFEGEHGLAAGFALRVDRNVQFNGGVAYGLSENTVGTRAGIRVGW